MATKVTKKIHKSEGLLPSNTPEDRTNVVKAAAYSLVEQRILEGTASAAEVTHFLRCDPEEDMLRKAKLRLEIRKLEVEVRKTEADIVKIEAETRTEEIAANAIEAFRVYSGAGPDSDDVYYDEDGNQIYYEEERH